MKIGFLQIVARHTNLNYWVSYESGWSYLISTGLVKALKARYSDIVYIPSDCITLAEQVEFCDIIIINDVHHAFGNIGDVCDLGLEILIKLFRTKKTYGIINETLFEDGNQDALQSINLYRAKLIKQCFPFFHGLITADYLDFQILKRASVNVLYSPFAVPILKGSIRRKTGSFRPLFLGSLYDKRRYFYEQNNLLDRVSVANIAFDMAAGGKCCDKIRSAVYDRDNVGYFTNLDDYKFKQFRNYICALGAANIVVNLPSIFRGIPCRLVEAAQLNSYILCEFPRSDFEISMCSGLSNVIFYRSDLVGDLLEKLDAIAALPEPNPSDISDSWFDIRVRSGNILNFILNESLD